MNIIKPRYYDDFECIGAPCPDSCCIKWEIDVDDKSRDYYKTVSGPFGDKLKNTMKEANGETTFPLVNGRCPFLNNGNLCDIYINIGKDKLCETCTKFPRYSTEYGLTREIGISLSCPVAAKMIVFDKEKFSPISEITSEGITQYNDIDPQKYIELKTQRKRIIETVQNRELPFSQRVLSLLKDDGKVSNVDANDYVNFCKTMEVMDKKWLEILDERNERPTDTELEQIFVYYIYRYYLNSVFDGKEKERLKLASFAVIVISQLGVSYAYKFAKETEHGDNNVNILLENFNSNILFSSSNFIKILNKI